MRSGLEGVVSTVPLPVGEPGVTGETTDAQGRLWHWRFHASKPLHRVQGAWMRENPSEVMGVHGTWLNATTAFNWYTYNSANSIHVRVVLHISIKYKLFIAYRLLTGCSGSFRCYNKIKYRSH